MLDTDSPMSGYIFAASEQINLIHCCLMRMTLAHGKWRRDGFLIAEPAFHALRWLNQAHFANSPKIRQSIDKMEEQLHAFSALEQKFEVRRGERMKQLNCPLCNSEIRRGERMRQLNCPICNSDEVEGGMCCADCFEKVSPFLTNLRSGDCGFGTECI